MNETPRESMDAACFSPHVGFARRRGASALGVAAGLALALTGCGESADSATRLPAPDIRPLSAGTEVRVLGIEGDYATVETGDGSKRYVDRGLVKRRDMRKEESDPARTHLLVRDAPSFQTQPASPPEPPPARNRAEIDREQLSLNALYLGEKTGVEVIAPRNGGPVVDPRTGERCWRALQCRNPDCPGPKRPGHDHFLFAVSDEDLAGQAIPVALVCPSCRALRDPARETAADRRRYNDYVGSYELPETLFRIRQLDAERAARYRLDRAARQRAAGQ